MDELAGESGGRADVRWMAMSADDGSGLAALTTGSPLQMNVTRWAALIWDLVLHAAFHSIVPPLWGLVSGCFTGSMLIFEG